MSMPMLMLMGKMMFDERRMDGSEQECMTTMSMMERSGCIGV